MNLFQEYWQIFLGLLAGTVWSIRLEGKVHGMEKKEREDPAIRKQLFELYAKTERENVTLRLDILAGEVKALKGIVEGNHGEVLSRISDLKKQ